MSKPVVSYPQPHDRLVQIAQDIFTPVKDSVCVSCFFISGSGKRTVIKFLLQEKEILRKIFDKNFEKTLFVYVDPDEILGGSNEAYLRLTLDHLLLKIREIGIKPITHEATNPIFTIKQNVQNLISKNWHIVFLLNDFEFTLSLDPSIYRNLESIHSLDKSKVAYVFLSTINFLEENTLAKLHNFKYAINRVVYYHPLLDEKTIVYVLDKFEDQLKIKLSFPMKEVLKKLCDGHIQLLKYCIYKLKEAGKDYLKIPQKAQDYLISNNQLRSVCADIWNYFSLDEKEIIISAVKTGKIPSSLSSKSDFVLNTGLIKKTKSGSYVLFGELFQNFVLDQFPKEKIIYDQTMNQIFYGSIKCSDKFTFQEFKLLVHFLKNEGKVISRDEIGQVLWGRNYVEKFSDWSIDKIISSIRKKFDQMDFPSSKLVTLKKRGFTFSN
ncbi:hypothetical protein A3A46_04395 [Candidatus Roizmanbacteria bacterium RIFCSPLOWO2_01_FULL_37_13]|uniref:OmpR/PhoB-type domain-containing protein n=1 Tax=Candidatus Roizmanbacteria bacterium RIFCSPHIGHO2_02_FULL_38_11 TaxID=1802039 RepID=A0A1F7GWS1_9BACT|nr:MAG: hypothetical protein A3C25_05605 [Candidatus Roizmanbacteria bacterium RIFCSPHIGHO2_02_FULL_38_11]OGK43016.1 MAG: hypothetical protein A3A46_04395 [Candidatus Roizmanbacteria bacterium RIFCSPLOWO2_01_FULL_37_13]